MSNNPWLIHRDKVKIENPELTYKEVIELAKNTYVKKVKPPPSGRPRGRPKGSIKVKPETIKKPRNIIVYNCAYCEHTSQDIANFRRHIDIVHSKERELAKCEILKRKIHSLCVIRKINEEETLVIRDHEQYDLLREEYNRHANRLMDIEFGIDKNIKYQPRKRKSRRKKRIENASKSDVSANPEYIKKL